MTTFPLAHLDKALLIWDCKPWLDVAGGEVITAASSWELVDHSGPGLVVTLSTNGSSQELQDGRIVQAGTLLEALVEVEDDGGQTWAVGSQFDLRLRAVTSYGRQDDRTIQIYVMAYHDQAPAVFTDEAGQLRYQLDLSTWLRPGETVTSASAGDVNGLTPGAPSPTVSGGGTIQTPQLTPTSWAAGGSGSYVILFDTDHGQRRAIRLLAAFDNLIKEF